MNKVKVTLYKIMERDRDYPLKSEPFFECMATSMGDAIRQANAKGICCHDLDYYESYPERSIYENADWDYEMDLSNLDLEGLYIPSFPCAHSENYIENANLKNAYIYLIRPKALSLVNCDLRGATINWEDDFYFLDLRNSKMDKETSITEPETCLEDAKLEGTILVNNGIYMPMDKKVIYFHGVHSDKLEKEILRYRGKIVSSITPECNLIIVKRTENLPKEIEEAKENGIGVMDFETIKWHYYVNE